MELNLIRKIAWSYNKTTGIDFDDLFSEACIAYLEGQSKFDPNQEVKVSLTIWKNTFLWEVMQSHLNSIIPKYKDSNTFTHKNIAAIDEVTPEAVALFKDQINSLSKEARAVCKMIFDSPHVFLTLNTPKLSRGRIKTHLREIGWSWGAIWRSFREIKASLSQMRE